MLTFSQWAVRFLRISMTLGKRCLVYQLIVTIFCISNSTRFDNCSYIPIFDRDFLTPLSSSWFLKIQKLFDTWSAHRRGITMFRRLSRFCSYIEMVPFLTLSTSRGTITQVESSILQSGYMTSKEIKFYQNRTNYPCILA